MKQGDKISREAGKRGPVMHEVMCKIGVASTTGETRTNRVTFKWCFPGWLWTGDCSIYEIEVADE